MAISAPDVVGYSWAEFEEWFKGRWEPGDHMAFLGPTKVGKSTAACAILPMRKYVVAFDPKGGDRTLATLLNKGFVRLPTWPPSNKIRRDIADGKPARFILGQKIETVHDLPVLRRTLAAALEDVFAEGGWTVYVDELQIAADRRLMNLSGSIERLLIAARDKGVSVVTSYQRPAWVPRTASEMAWWFCCFYTRDLDTQDRIAQMAGRPKAEIRGAMRALGKVPHAFMVFAQDPSIPIIVTRAPKAG